ncbi:MAG: ABC transporter permease [Ruminiclostridium sp.]
MSNLFQIRKKIEPNLYVKIALSSFIIFVIIWQVLCSFKIVNTIFLPSPLGVLKYFVNDIVTGNIWENLYISCYRIFMGFLLAAIIGVPIGIFVGCFNTVEAYIQPMIEFFRYLPVPAFIPLIMIWAGIGEGAKIAVILLGTLFQLIPMVADDVRSVPEDYINAAYTLGANRAVVLCKVIIPAMLPRLMNTLRMIMGWAWTYLVVAELVAANSGLGYSILKAQRYLRTPAIFSGILVIGLLGLIIDRTFGWVSKRLFPWAEGGAK